MRIRTLVLVLALAVLAALVVLSGCGSTKAQQKNKEFFTSGSQEADQRASQRMAQSEQLTGSGEKNVKETSTPEPAQAGSPGSESATNTAPRVEGKLALFDRLGGAAGISNIVADFLPRAMQDPRVNWDRKDVTRGGISFHRDESVTWDASRASVALLTRHIIEFLSLATGGPAHYDGKEMKESHARLHISNAEFDATVGDLKASLDRLQIPNTEQKELLAIVESTRPEIVTER
jgi:hemoglobin